MKAENRTQNVQLDYNNGTLDGKREHKRVLKMKRV
jgi:hypothetical protein